MLLQVDSCSWVHTCGHIYTPRLRVKRAKAYQPTIASFTALPLRHSYCPVSICYDFTPFAICPCLFVNHSEIDCTTAISRCAICYDVTGHLSFTCIYINVVVTSYHVAWYRIWPPSLGFLRMITIKWIRVAGWTPLIFE